MNTWDKISDNRIETLHPMIRENVISFVNEVQSTLSIKVRITDALRTWNEQNELYKQGRTKPGKIVTWVRGGMSAHNYGLAFDICKIDGSKAIWNMSDNEWRSIADISNKYGFTWGYDLWGKDKPHFQNLFGNSLNSLMAIYSSGKVDSEGYVFMNDLKK
jgi:peptidoglycan L-alanyl-D-glutamate endopeptidase CwlK